MTAGEMSGCIVERTHSSALPFGEYIHLLRSKEQTTSSVVDSTLHTHAIWMDLLRVGDVGISANIGQIDGDMPATRKECPGHL
jgi:hypothetical protein